MRSLLLFVLIIISFETCYCQILAGCEVELNSNFTEVICGKTYYPQHYEVEVELSEFTTGSSRCGFRKKNRLFRKFIDNNNLNLIRIEDEIEMYQKSFWNIVYNRKVKKRVYKIQLNRIEVLENLLHYLLKLEVKEVTFNRILYPDESEILSEIKFEAIESIKRYLESNGAPCTIEVFDYDLSANLIQGLPPIETYYLNGYGRIDSINPYIHGIRLGVGLARVEDVYSKPWNEIVQIEQFQEQVIIKFIGTWQCKED